MSALLLKRGFFKPTGIPAEFAFNAVFNQPLIRFNIEILSFIEERDQQAAETKRPTPEVQHFVMLANSHRIQQGEPGRRHEVKLVRGADQGTVMLGTGWKFTGLLH